MTEKPTQTSATKNVELLDLLAASANFTPHKMAVKSDVDSGDTILSDKVVSNYDEATLRNLLAGWQSFAGEQDPQTPEGRSRLALAKKALAEHGLVASEFAQVFGEEDQSQTIRTFQQELHPYYSEDLYQTALDHKIKTFEQIAIEPTDFDTRTAHALFLDTLDELRSNGETVELIKPTTETLNAVGAWQKAQHQEALDFVDTIDKEKLDAQDIKGVFDNAIELSDSLRTAGWVAVVEDTEKNVITVYPIERRIVIPRQRTVDKPKLKSLVEHEVYGHALRSANAAVAGNEVGAVGTARQNSFEESFMLALEQCIHGTYDPERGINHYLSVGMAVTGELPQQEVARLFNSMHQLKEGKVSSEAVAAARRLTEGQLSRTFAGMTDVDDGIANRAIIDYLHGLNDAWKLLNYLTEHDAVDEGMRWLMTARFNPYDSDDRDLVNQYHPMPTVLNGYFTS